MKIGVVADTNDNQDGLKQLLDRFLVGGMQWLLHCGGLGSASLVELLKPWQVHMVAGEREPNRQAIELALQKARLQAFLPTEMKLTLEGVRIGLCRNDAMNVVNQWIRSGQFDYIFHGFTLRRSDRSVGKTRIINPGALGGPRYQTRSGVLIDLAYGEVRAVSVLIYATEPHSCPCPERTALRWAARRRLRGGRILSGTQCSRRAPAAPLRTLGVNHLGIRSRVIELPG